MGGTEGGDSGEEEAVGPFAFQILTDIRSERLRERERKEDERLEEEDWGRRGGVSGLPSELRAEQAEGSWE